MATTLDEIEARVTRLEADVAQMKGGPARPSFLGPVSPERQAMLSRMFRDVLRQMGIDDIDSAPRVTPEELKQRMLEHGIRPEDRIISRELRRLHGEDDEE